MIPVFFESPTDVLSTQNSLVQLVERFVLETVDSLPQEFSSKIENIAFIVTDWPSGELRRQLNLEPGYLLFGLYQGVPKPKKPFANQIHPDRITIFANPLLAVSSSVDELKTKTRNTVLHEIGHYFGLNDKQIKQIESSKGVKY
jgi:predicted Zn-dependent protease with MMP-like domain